MNLQRIVLVVTITGVVFVTGIALTAYYGSRADNVGTSPSQTTHAPPAIQAATATTAIVEHGRSKWIGTSFCGNKLPQGVVWRGQQNRIFTVLTDEGEERWLLNATDHGYPTIPGCALANTVIDSLTPPAKESGTVLVSDNCSARSMEGYDILDLVEAKEYERPTLTQIAPKEVWAVKKGDGSFMRVDIPDLRCFSFEPDPE